MGIETGINALFNSGQNLQQPDLVGKYFAGSQIAQNNQNQAFQNKLLGQRADLANRQFNRLEAQDIQQQEQLASQNAAFQQIISNATNVDESPDPQHQQVMETLRLQWASGDRKGAVDNYVKSVQSLGQVKTIGSPLTDDQGNVTVLVQDPSSEHGMSAVSMGMYGKSKKQENGLNIGFGDGGQLSTISMGGNQPLATPKAGTLASGEMPVLTPEGGIGVQVVPGSELERKNLERQASTESKQRQTNDTAVSMISLIEDIKSTLNPNALGLRGSVGKKMNFFGTSNMEELESKMVPIKSNLSIQAMELMRQGSASGATGMGAMSEKEQEMIETTIHGLNPLFPEEFWKGLNKIQYHFDRLGQMANGVDPGPFDPSVYEGAPNRETYQTEQIQSEAAKAMEAATRNPLQGAMQASPAAGKPQGTSEETLTATNPKTGQRVISYDGGMTWQNN